MGAVRQVNLVVAPDARPRELRAALTSSLRMHETAELRLLHVDESGRTTPAVFSAGLRLAEAAALVLDTGAPPPAPSWHKLHAPQLIGVASLVAWRLLPSSIGALALLALAYASALIAPPGGKGVVGEAAPTAALLITGHAFHVLHASALAMPSSMASLGCYCAFGVAAFRMRVLLVNMTIMLGQQGLVKAIAWETSNRRAAAPPTAGVRR